ncbi:hypothetical protein K8R14_03370 [bacterium]|nr:hypothetical protein [bacterium]
MDNIVTQNTGEDSVKRLKIILLSFVLSFSLFFTKIFAQESSLLMIYVVGGIYFFVSVIGLLWAFNYKVKIRSLIYILQGGLFVFSEVLFVLVFFFQQFDRIYEGVLLFILLCFIWVITYVCFLMVNVFNVALYKSLPLLQVAQTASYILSLLMIYFFTFSILTSGFPLYVMFPLLFILYLFILFMQFNELDMEKGIIWRRVILLSLINMFTIIPFIFIGSTHEIVAIVPTVGGFVGGGLLNLSGQKDVKWQVFGYNVILLIAIVLAVYFCWF